MSNGFIQRLKQVLAYYELSPSQFADQIGVQRSSVSHLLSGRNRPSLDFVLKIVAKFPEVNLYWLLNGNGSFPPLPEQNRTPQNMELPTIKKNPRQNEKEIKRIVIFYEDGSFETYNPS